MSTEPSPLDRALDRAGLLSIPGARARGEDLETYRERLAAADLLLVGALADRVRAAEVGDVVTIAIRESSAGDPRVVRLPSSAPSERGLALLRAVATARILSPRGANVVVDWAECGMELAQVALSFGASGLVGPVVSRRGLPIAEDRTKKVKGEGLVPLATLKQRELVSLVRRLGREPVMEASPSSAAAAATEVMA